MKVNDVMTIDPACCISDTALQEVAQMMIDHDCGEIPVVDNKETKRPIGVITDRDIVCRGLAKGLNPLDLTAEDCMTTPCVTVTRETPVGTCAWVMEDKKIRRVVVVDAEGSCCGIVALADIARLGKSGVTTEIVKELSESSAAASAAGK